MRDRIAQTAKTVSSAQTVSAARNGRSDGAARPAPFKRPSGRASYPHRLTLDLDPGRFDWLRRQAYEARVPAASLLRAAIDLLQIDDSLLAEAVQGAVTQNPPPG
jgi:hypothetical protein